MWDWIVGWVVTIRIWLSERETYRFLTSGIYDDDFGD